MLGHHITISPYHQSNHHISSSPQVLGRLLLFSVDLHHCHSCSSLAHGKHHHGSILGIGLWGICILYMYTYEHTSTYIYIIVIPVLLFLTVNIFNVEYIFNILDILDIKSTSSSFLVFFPSMWMYVILNVYNTFDILDIKSTSWSLSFLFFFPSLSTQNTFHIPTGRELWSANVFYLIFEIWAYLY